MYRLLKQQASVWLFQRKQKKALKPRSSLLSYRSCEAAYVVQVSFVSVERFLRELLLVKFFGMDMVRMYGGCSVICFNLAVSSLLSLGDAPSMAKLKPHSVVWLHSQNNRSWKPCSSSVKALTTSDIHNYTSFLLKKVFLVLVTVSFEPVLQRFRHVKGKPFVFHLIIDEAGSEVAS